jgi:Domain of unknown function (DUF4352)
MQQPPNSSQQYPQQQWQQQNTSWGSPTQWQQSEPLPPQYPQQMPPPQQLWQQQPYYSPPYQPPEKPHSAFKLGLGIGCGIMAAFVIGIVVLAILVSAGRQNSTAQQQFATQPASKPTVAPTQTMFKIGDTASNTLWNVTLNGAKEVTSGTFSQPGAGNIFLVVDVTTQNLSSSPQLVSSGASFTLKDTTGQVYNEKVTGIGVPPDNTSLQPNDKLRGQISYEVPKSLHDFTFQFQGSMLDASAATWAFTI